MRRREEVELSDKKITLETGQVARQAHAAVIVRHQRAMVLATVVAKPADRDDEGRDSFLPLTVEYRERMSAAGRIPGGFGRRELRMGDHEILTSRLIDRTVRPLFPKGFTDEVQVLVTVYGAEASSDLESLALIAATTALYLSPLPVSLATGLKLARIGERVVLLPSDSERTKADIDATLAVTRDGVVMVEAGASEADEDALVALMREATAAASTLLAAVERLATTADDAPNAVDHTEPEDTRAAIRQQVLAGTRSDGRAPDELRAISCEAGYVPANHGSALFTRGETQALVSVTLGAPDEGLISDTMLKRRSDRFFLHYNFPPFSVGEIRPSRGPGRREIGHGALARRALAPVMPPDSELPFTVRVVSDILESNGSSSMATVCGASLALMDAGVQIRRPVAGIAMGLVLDGDRVVVLSDISGAEDDAGDMDFKVAGTREGITALQLDNKIGAVPLEVLAEALGQARENLRQILDVLGATLGAPRPTVPDHAPQIAQIRIPSHRVGTLIGAGGKTIQELQRATSSKIDVKDDGRVRINARRASDLKAALDRIEQLTLELEVGKVYPAEVVRLKEYGAFVRIGDHEGLVHISELAPKRIDNVEDVLTLGETIEVKVLGADKRGRLELSRKAAM